MELLPDPANDRFVPTLEPPPNKPLAEDVLYPYKGEYWLVHFNQANLRQTQIDVRCINQF